MEILVLLWVVCGIGAAVVANNRGANGCLWFGLGVLFGPIGLAFAFTAGDTKSCRFCKSQIPQEALRCPKCHADLMALSSDARAVKFNSGTGYECPICKHVVEFGARSCPNCKQEFYVEPSTTSKVCPDCAEEVKAEARKCRFCGYIFG